MLQIREHAPIIFFFHYFILGPTFGSFEEFGGTSLGFFQTVDFYYPLDDIKVLGIPLGLILFFFPIRCII
jgi:hypothetical protein